VPLSCNLGTLTSQNPLGHSRPVTGLLYDGGERKKKVEEGKKKDHLKDGRTRSKRI